MEKIKDILLFAVPLGPGLIQPLPAIFYLKSFIEMHGKTATCVEGNHVEHIQGSSRDGLLNEIKTQLERHKWIGISILTFKLLDKALEIVKNLDIDPKRIIWGGPGTSEIKERLDNDDEFVKDKCRNVIYGEGEYALLEFLNGNMDYPGINSDPIQIENLDELPPPDYGDIKAQMVGLTGSRGCVRKCKFCNVPLLWKKYRYVDGEILAKNAITVLSKNTHTNHVMFSDSLINGSEKQFRKMCTTLTEHNKKHPDNKITWEAQYISRKVSPDHFKIVSDSGCKILKIGIESGSERLRNVMAKKFNDDAMYKCIDGFMTVDDNVNLVLMLIVGYPDETDEDFEKTLDFLEWCSKYNSRIKMSPTIMSVIPDTPIFYEQPELMDNNELSKHKDYTWVNENSTLYDRVKRLIKFETLVKYYKYTYEPSIAYRWDDFLNGVMSDMNMDYKPIYKDAISELIKSKRLPDNIPDIYEKELSWPDPTW
tara:strand:- start:1709 stop:3151 length:1443 start_codon:yes stop_codon:yes gene_type:complete